MDQSLATTPFDSHIPGIGQPSAKMTDQLPTTTPEPSNAAASDVAATQTSQQSSATNSVTPSPLGSRDSSPTRRPRRITSSTAVSGSRSRKNSQTDLSPSRQTRPGLTGIPLSSRSLSTTTVPSLLPKESQIYAPTPQKPSVTSDPREGRRWPVSPRLKSPPLQPSKPGTPSSTREMSEQPPAINVQKASPLINPTEAPQLVSESDTEESQTHSGMRTPVRGALETVQEVSLPNSPNPANKVFLDQIKEKLSPSEDSPSETALDGRTLRARSNAPAPESGSDTSNAKIDRRRTTSVPPPVVTRQSSALSSKAVKAPAEGSTQNMTVETETVPSVPQVALATGSKTDGASGTLKTKPSSETIKPKKDKKKSTRKQPVVTSGNASSKADVFEAKIASAVDENNESDSEETFVYDSNPPDKERNQRRFHSRTPSATSMASQADRQNVRSIYGVMEGSGHTHTHKKSMKFASTSTNNASGADSLTPGDEDGRGTGRSTNGSGRGTMRQHHHFGRWGRNGNTHPSLFDNESPFPNAARAKMTGSRNSSGPPSPRNQPRAHHLHTKRSAYQLSSAYDNEDTPGADDERTPLMGSTRTFRRKKGPTNLRQVESQQFNQGSSYLNRFAACLVLTIMFLFVITGAIGFMFATSQPMTEIEVTAIKNVVTSQQVLVFDLTVKAHNPNIVVITVDQANLDIFAKSEHAGDGDWWKHILDPPSADKGSTSWIEPPVTIEPPDDDNSAPNFLLGRITEFDSPLTFEGSLFHQGSTSSTGELQLASPGDGTKDGVDKWSRIYQNEFDLIVKGVVKYTLPLSARVRSATISGRTTVKPNSANDPSLKPNSTDPETG